MLVELSCPNVLAFPDFEAAISGSRTFRLPTDASADGLGVVIEQQRLLCYLSRTTLDSERKWSISELECAAITQSIRRNRKMFYGMPFERASGIHPSELLTSSDSNSGGLATSSGGLANALGGLATTPDDVFFFMEGERVVHARKNMVNRCCELRRRDS